MRDEKTEKSPLIEAIKKRDIVAVTRLLAAGADPNGGTDRTPLQAAVECGDLGNAQALLRNGAKVNFQRPGFGTPLYYARDNIEMAALLRKAGGKLRSPVAVKSRDTKPLPPTSPPAKVQITPRDQKLTIEDTQVLERVLLDFLAYRGKDLYFLNDKTTSLMVINTTRVFSVGSETQLDMDLENQQALTVTLAMRESLVARNATSISLASWKPISSTLQLRDQKAVTETFGRFGEKETTARAAILLSLPGYSPQRETAVLRFSFSPTPHGASGTYFLKKLADKWEIAWRHFAYYA
ncbi:ankyrin repeat domain-containing protein [Armatimonas sp.]|uniref:ankyrin repeat domain-containing protein n=1 Tax=Armatimonas sp. TaxID=1872638 RepID=UPI00375317D1